MKDNTKTNYKELSDQRKNMQQAGEIPEHWITASWQMFKENYLHDALNPREQYERIANVLAQHRPEDVKWWAKTFFDLMWEAYFSPSTPLLANTGTNRGYPVSCSGCTVEDSLDDIYKVKHEIAMLSKQGFGTSVNLSKISPRGTLTSRKFKATGVVPIIEGLRSDMSYVAQGTSRRGSVAVYLDIEHGDAEEVLNFLATDSAGINIGWIIHDSFVKRLESGDEQAEELFKKVAQVKLKTGKGYLTYPDKINAKRPDTYKALGLEVNMSNLCTEITLFSDAEHTFTCVLGSLNLTKWDEIKNSNRIFNSIVLLDCVAKEFIRLADGVAGMQKAVDFTRKSKALGLGVMGWHSLLKARMLPFDSFGAHMLNNEVFSTMRREADRASVWLAQMDGEPEWCKGSGRANTHCLAVAPTKSTALLMGGVSEGINPDPALVYTAITAAGIVDRVDPALLKIMKERGKYTKEIVEDIRVNESVQHVDWLTDEEKLVFRTAFEIDNFAIIRQATARGKWLDQWQSVNLFISANDTEEYVADLLYEVTVNPDMLCAYYAYSTNTVSASRDEECAACQ